MGETATRNVPNPAAEPEAFDDLLSRRGHVGFHWDDLDSVTLSTGVVSSMYRVGLTSTDDAPTVFKVYFPPGCTVEAHTHDCDYTEILLEGSQKVGNQWFHAGDVRVGLANRGYGPLVAGPDGVTVLFVFKDGRWPALTIGNNDGSTLGSDELENHYAARRQ